MKKLMKMITGILALMIIFGGAMLDSEGTIIPSLMVIVGITGEAIVSAFYWKILR